MDDTTVERSKYSKYIYKGRFPHHIYLAEDEIQKIREDLKTGCRFQIQNKPHKKQFVWCDVTYWWYCKDNGTFYLVTNDARRQIIKLIDEIPDPVDTANRTGSGSN